jgi:class 3 adenylate cyclase/tetratricopeptide (TPR) repeat protein
MVTFLLTDIEGSTTLWEAHRRTMGAALARHEALIAKAVTSHGGHLIKARGEGDSTLSVFERASDAVAAALALLETLASEAWPDGIALPTRMALHTGEAELRDGDYYGPTLNRAARLRSLAHGGQILLSRATADLVVDELPVGVTLTDVGGHRLKGLSRPEHVFALLHPDIGVVSTPLAPTTEAHVESVFVGRGAELDRLDAALEDALAGQGRLVLVAGEPGIGKTRIAEQLVARARARAARAVWGRCFEGEGAPAYWPWIQLLRAHATTRSTTALRAELGPGATDVAQLLPEVAEAIPDLEPPLSLDPETARFRLFDAVASFLRRAARETGLVVVLDDLHWADRSSLLLLEFVARVLAESRLLLVGTYRDVEVSRHHPLSDTLAELIRQPVTSRLVLRGLSEAEVARCIAAVTGTEPTPEVVAAVHSQSEGNPFFVGEIARLLVSEDRLGADGHLDLTIPEGVREVVDRRLNRLTESCNGVLAVAAVEGRDFDLSVVSQAAGLPASEVLETLDEAVDAHLVTEAGSGPGRYRFAHALVREVVYAGLRVTERVRLHHRVGEAIERHSQPDLEARLAELAHHFLQSSTIGDADKAVEYASRAGKLALDMLAYEQAAGHFEGALQALELTGPGDGYRRGELLLVLGEAQRAAGDLAAARASYEQAAAAAERIGAAELLARAALGLGVEFTVGVVDDMEVRLLEEALTALGDVDSQLRARVLARLAKALLWTRQEDHRAALSEQAVQVARRVGDPGSLAAVLHDRHMAIWGFANAEERLAITGEEIGLAERCGDRDLAVRARASRIANLLELGDMQTLETEIARHDHETHQLRQLQYRWHIPLLRASQAAIAGRFAEAEQLAEEGLEVGRRAHHQGVGLFHLGVVMAIRFGQGRFPELHDVLRQSDQRYPSLAIWRCSMAYALVEAARDNEALVEFERQVKDEFAPVPRDHLWTTCMAFLGLTCAALHDADRAAKLYDLLLPYARYNHRMTRIGIGSLGPIAHYLGLLAATTARWDAAAGHFHAAMQMSTRMAAPVFLANSRYHYAQTLLATPGREQEARELIDQALAGAHAVGVRLQLERRSPGTPASQPQR